MFLFYQHLHANCPQHTHQLVKEISFFRSNCPVWGESHPQKMFLVCQHLYLDHTRQFVKNISSFGIRHPIHRKCFLFVKICIWTTRTEVQRLVSSYKETMKCDGYKSKMDRCQKYKSNTITNIKQIQFFSSLLLSVQLL